jgi:hypothetical protein
VVHMRFRAAGCYCGDTLSRDGSCAGNTAASAHHSLLVPIDRRAFVHSCVAVGVTLASLVAATAATLAKHPAAADKILIGRRTDDIQSLDPHESVSSSAAEII